MKVVCRKSGFTLIELLVVIAILGILAGLAVPALKNLGKSNANISASRQLLDGVGRARQLAIANRTTVYMVFVPTNFWNNSWLTSLAPAERIAATNLCDKQLTGYTFISDGQLGDQPGQHTWRYLEPWQNLPDDSFIAAQKFSLSGTMDIPQWEMDYGRSAGTISNFVTMSIPFPMETSANVFMPSIAFNYLGQLTFDGVNLATRDEYIPLAQGTVFAARDPNTKAFQFAPADVTENPPGNSTGISYNVIHIDALTGRAVLEFYKMK